MGRASGSRPGAFFQDGRVHVRAWAPEHRRVDVVVYTAEGAEEARSVPMGREADGTFTAVLEGAGPGTLYKLRVDGAGPFPDPYSRAQPFGVHGPSQVADEHFPWSDAGWHGVALEDLVVCELHVGTFTRAGTFDAAIPHLAGLRALGFTAVELMPVSSFPGTRNWGYDGVSHFAPAQPYGGPAGLKRLVDAAHRANLAVVLDVVYNHFGPDGNYLGVYSKQYFTDRVKTPWGDALDYREPHMRELALSNAEMWVRDFHVDALRLDATHAIHDDSAPHILRALGERARAAAPHRRVLVIAEDERNEARIVTPVERGGFGLDAVWADDFHHEMRVAFAGDKDGYFADFTGSAAEVARALQDGWVFDGQYSRHLRGPRGTSPAGIGPARFVHCIQNHDQIGNRAFGDRLGDSVSPEAFRAMSALLLLSPHTPLVFMGQEWNAKTPFLYFTDHEPNLGRAVTEGRRREFESFASFRGREVPDPQAPATFEQSRLDRTECDRPAHAGVLAWYRELLRLRATHPAARRAAPGSFLARAVPPRGIALERRSADAALLVLANVRNSLDHRPPGRWRLLAWSGESRFGGTGDPAQVWDGTTARIRGPGAVVLESA